MNDRKEEMNLFLLFASVRQRGRTEAKEKVHILSLLSVLLAGKLHFLRLVGPLASK
jgi:hypothetical protein